MKANKLSPAVTYIALNLVLAALYFGSARLGLAMAFAAEQVTVIWPPTGIALVAIIVFGYRMWPGIALGAFLANIMADESMGTALGITAGNTLEALAGAWMLRRAQFDNHLSRLRDVLGLVVFSACISTMIGATIGITSLSLGGVQPWKSYGQLWRLWWLGDATGALIIAPLLLVWRSGARQAFPYRRDMMEAVVLLAALLVVCTVVFIASPLNSGVFIYTVFPFVIWAALRFRQHGATIVTLIASAAAIWATLHGSGPFTGLSVEHNLILLQFFMGVMSITGLLLSAAVAESRHTEAMLRDNEERLAAELKAMNDLYNYSAKLATAPNLQAALNEVLDAGITITKADLGNIQILNHEGSGLEIAVHCGFKQDFLEHFKLVPLTEGSSACGRAVESGNRFMIEDIEKDPEYAEHLDIARLAGYQAVQSTPLLDRKGKILGMLSTHFRMPQLPSDHQLQMLDLYALQAAAMIERMHAEEALQLADQRKNEFLATLAHELRNPLSPIMGAAQVLQQPGADAARHKEACAIISHQAQHMSRLVDDLLDISRIAYGKIELRKERTALADAIFHAVETVKPLFESRRHHFVSDPLPEPLWLNADPVRLSQIFANLLNNAAKYTPPGGQIRLSVASDDDTITVKVRDNGIGISKAMQGRIFDMFTQADSSIERTYGGLGIGLTLVKNLVEMHGGWVEAVSAGEGQGSEFIVHLPRAAAPLPTSESTSNVSIAPHHLRVLVVDDHVPVAKTLVWMLEALGYEARMAHDAEGAMKAAHDFKPDILMLDIGLPGVNGYELCKRLRAEPDLINSIFIAQTGWGQPEQRERSKEAGFDYHLVKPVDIDLLEKILLSAKRC